MSYSAQLKCVALNTAGPNLAAVGESGSPNTPASQERYTVERLMVSHVASIAAAAAARAVPSVLSAVVDGA